MSRHTLSHELEAAYRWRELVVERCARLKHPVAPYGEGIGMCPCGVRMEMVIEGQKYTLNHDRLPKFDAGAVPHALLAGFNEGGTQ